MRLSRALPPVLFPLLLSALAWLTIFVAIPPARQNFPLNDDWAYARGLFAWARGEGIHYFGWTSIPLLGQWIWAWPWVKALGESHAVLRLSTVALSLVGVAAFYDLLRRGAGISPRRAAFGAATLALNPLFLIVSGTFMGDVPALSFALIALALATRALKTASLGAWEAASLAAALGVLTRQNAIAAPLAAAIALGATPTLRRRPVWWLVAVVPIVAGLLANQWLLGRADVVRQGMFTRLPDPDVLVRVPFVAAIYLGLAVLPILLLTPTLRRPIPFLLAFFGMLAGAAWMLFAKRQAFPYLGNLITQFGQMTVGVELVGRRDLLLAEGEMLALTLLGCIGGAALLARIVAALRGGSVPLLRSPLLLYSALHLAFLFLLSRFFDRYLLTLLPAAITLCLVAARQARPQPLAGIAALVLSGFLGTAMVHDWFAWNAARWELGRRALARGIAVADLEGGTEWDAWHSPRGVERNADLDHLVPPENLALAWSKTLFPYLTGHYALSFSPLRGTTVLDREPYRFWLLPGRREFYLVALE